MRNNNIAALNAAREIHKAAGGPDETAGADMARDIARMTQNDIVSQAAASVLAQAESARPPL